MDKKQIIIQINTLLKKMSKERLFKLYCQLKKIPMTWRREHSRTPCSIFVDFDTMDYSKKKPVKNLSVDGAYIEADESFSVGQLVVLWLTITGEEGSTFKVEARVVRRDAKGVGVKFESLTQEQKELLKCLKQ